MRFRLFLVCVLFISCTKNKTKNKNEVIFALTSEAKTIDPRFATDANGQRIVSLIYNSLVRLGPELKIEGDAAKTWSYNDLTYTFNLHPGITFSNGDELIEEDIIFTFKEYLKDGVPFKNALNMISEVIPDFSDKKNPKVTLKLSKFSASILNDLSVIKILSKSITENSPNDLLGTGSFVFKKKTPNEIILEARKDHTIINPKINRVLFKIIRDESTLFLKTTKGDVDIVQSDMPAQSVSQFEKHKDFKVYKFMGLKMNYLLLNLKEQVFTKNVRLAIANALDIDSIIKYKLSGLGIPATSLLTPDNPFFNKNLKRIKFSLGEAKKVSKLVDKELSIKTSSSGVAVENGKVISNQLRSAGFKPSLQSYEWGTFYSDIQSGNFQIAIMRWVGATDPDIYRVAFHSKELPPVGRNRGFYINPKLDKLLEQGRTTENLTQRKNIYQKAQEIIHGDLPIIPLWYNTDVAIVNNRVLNYSPPLNGDFSPLYSVSLE